MILIITYNMIMILVVIICIMYILARVLSIIRVSRMVIPSRYCDSCDQDSYGHSNVWCHG